MTEQVRCSELGRYFLARGWRHIAKDCPDVVTEEGLEGVRLHHETTFASGVKSDDLSSEQNAAVQFCREEVEPLKKDSNWYFYEHYLENQLSKDWLLTGHTDFICRIEDTLIIFDFKFGWLSLLATMAQWQTNGYGYLAMKEWVECKRCIVKIFRPRAPEDHDRWHEVVIEREQVDRLGSKICAMLDLTRGETECEAGAEQCKHCPAYYKCPYLIKTLQQVPFEENQLDLYNKALDIADRLGPWADKVKSRAKLFELQNPGAFPGWEIVEQRAPRKVRDYDLFFEAVKQVLLPKDIIACCQVHLHKLEEIYGDLYKAKLNKPKYKGKEEFAKLIASSLEPEQKRLVFRKEKISGKRFEKSAPQRRVKAPRPDPHVIEGN